MIRIALSLAHTSVMLYSNYHNVRTRAFKNNVYTNHSNVKDVLYLSGSIAMQVMAATSRKIRNDIIWKYGNYYYNYYFGLTKGSRNIKNINMKRE